jgi:hypothetical protein
LEDFLIQILPKIPFFFIRLPLTIRFQSSMGGAISVTAEAFSQQAQNVVPILPFKIGIYFSSKNKFLSLSFVEASHDRHGLGRYPLSRFG